MSTKATRTRRPRGSIDADQILTGAFEVARRDGLESLSMPVLATHLGIGVTSIYWYFDSKDDLLHRMSNHAVELIESQMPSTEGWRPSAWRSFLEEHAHRDRAVHRADALLTDLTLLRTTTYGREVPSVIYSRWEARLAYLVSAGLSKVTAWRVLATMTLYVNGFVVNEQARLRTGSPPTGLRQVAHLDVEATPLLRGLVEEHEALLDLTGDDSFEFGLAMILDRAEALATKEKRATRGAPGSRAAKKATSSGT